MPNCPDEEKPIPKWRQLGLGQSSQALLTDEVGQIGVTVLRVNGGDVGEVPDFPDDPPAWTRLYYGMPDSDSDSESSESALRDDFPWTDRYEGLGPREILIRGIELGLLDQRFKCVRGADKALREYFSINVGLYFRNFYEFPGYGKSMPWNETTETLVEQYRIRLASRLRQPNSVSSRN